MLAEPQNITVAVVQAATESYSLPRTLDKLEAYTRSAREEHSVQLVVFPEAFLGGYPKFSTFDVVIGERRDSGREEYLRYHSGAIALPSPELSRIEEISKAYNVFLVIGIIERDGGTLYCTAIFVDPKLGYVAKHRKLAPTAAERIVWGQGDGSTLPVHAHTFLTDEKEIQAKISATICWENYMPLLRTFYYGLGTQIYCAPTVDARPEWQHTMIHIALEGRCFVLAACQFAQEKHYPQDHPVRDSTAREAENVMIAGGSVIVSPLGKVLAGPLLGKEGILSATIDLNDCVRGKFDLDVAGHYARPDVFQLHANVKSP